MPKNLVIVESPTKAMTISKYLGKDFVVRASVGHVRDLPPKELGVDVEHGFHPTYHVAKGKGKVIQQIREAAAGRDLIYLATDPDREGEAIAWHVSSAAHLDKERLRRVVFHQITKSAVQEAIEHPRALDRDLIDAQQARRVLDRLVGYKISPLLSKTMRKALSAGRVQSIALRLVVDREREIVAFVPEESWTLDALLERRTEGKERFKARLFKIRGKDPELQKRVDVDDILPILSPATYTVTAVRKGKRQRKPQAPFVTSTLQAQAGSRLRYSPRQTMRLAQQLYEGIDLDGERVGLITYMRTDSTHVAPEAQQEAREYIAKRWGGEYLPDRPPVYRSKVANAQEAHEAIRPTSVLRTPDAIRSHLDNRQLRLYRLIWQRFLASQMQPAVYATLRVDIMAATDYMFRATGQRLIFPGYLAVYNETDDEDKAKDSQMLPALAVGETVDLIKLVPEQHFTQPPPRYSEATLIKALEANGVGRPSTYASIVGVIQDRGYVVKEKRNLVPTSLGTIVCDILVATFSDIMDVGYTANMETRLDEIASGKLGYARMLGDFYRPFSEQVHSAKDAMPGAVERAIWADLPEALRERACPKCGKPLQVKVSGSGRFLGCSGYPECRYTLDLSDPENPQEQQEREIEFAEGEMCELCGGRMKIIRRGRNEFLGCENYPKCKNTRSILSEQIKLLAAQTACPECDRKPMEPRKGRYGEYLRCPHCEKNFSLRKLRAGGSAEGAPAATVDLACPVCDHKPIEKRAGRYGPYYHCAECGKNTSEKKMAKALEEG